MTDMQVEGLVRIAASRSVDETVTKIKHLLDVKDVKVFAVIDHDGEAEKAGLHMLPAKLVIFGNPKSGTPLMVAAPSAAIDLPLKLLVSEDEQGKVWISWNSARYLGRRHHLPEELMSNIAMIESLARAASE